MYPDYPFKSKFLSINGQQMHYVDEGDSDAEPVVMVHGNPTWSYYFRHLINMFSDQYRCIALDHIGMGLSEKPLASEYPFNLERRVNDLETLLNKLELKEDITLILHDWGGMIGMGYASKHPNKIKRLVLMNTAAFHLPAHMNIPWQLKLSRSFLGPILIQGLNAFCKGAVKSCVTRTVMDHKTAQAYLAPYNNWRNRHAVFRFVKDIPLEKEDESYDAVSSIEASLEKFQKLPILICWGMKDFVFTSEFLSHWSMQYPNAKIHKFEDAGHYILEDAHLDLIPLIQDFMVKE